MTLYRDPATGRFLPAPAPEVKPVRIHADPQRRLSWWEWIVRWLGEHC